MPDEDSAWKEILDRFFEEFLQFFFPEVYRDIDWSHKPVFLDKELQAILRGQKGRQYVDKLVRVRLLTGEKAWILIHVEIEGRPGPRFPRRLLSYNEWIYRRYGEEVVSLVVFTHAGRRFRVEPYDYQRWGNRKLFEFTAVKISSYRGREQELLYSRNPFALLVLAHLNRAEAGQDVGRKLSVKKELVRLLYERGYKRGDIMHLFSFLDWLVRLPPKLDERFEGWISGYERRKTMPYVTSIERIGIRKGERRGRREGRAEGLEEAIGAILRNRFGRKGARLLADAELPGSWIVLRRLLDRLLEAQSLGDAAALIAKAAVQARKP